MANPIKKISVKSVLGQAVKTLVPAEGSKMLMRVYGSAQDTKTVTTQFGDGVGFTGNFRAVNLITGEEFASNVLWVPDVLTLLIKAALADAEQVEFAFDIGVKANPDVAIGYEYVTASLVESREPDYMTQLAAKLPPLPLALAAPETTENQAEEKPRKK